MKKKLWLVTSLLVAVALLAGGCASKAIKPLTNTEKNRLIEIALNHPEVSKWLKEPSVYKIEVGWVGLGWSDSKATGWMRFDYEEIADGNLPSDRRYLAERVTIYPEVYIRVGEPVGMFISVAFDRETKEVVHVELQPGRPTAGPTPAKESHPEGMKSLRWLTDAEKDRVIEIALNTPEALRQLEKESHYETNLSWIAILWDSAGYEYSEYWGFEYEVVRSGIPRGFSQIITPDGEKIVGFRVPEEAEIYSRVTINFGEPPRWQVSVAVNPDTGKVALVEENPFRTGPTPPK